MSICELVACQKLLITPCALVTVPILSYTVVNVEKSRIPSHTSAHKRGKRKDSSVLCNEGQHHEPHDIMDVRGKFSTPHCAHKVGIWTKKVANEFETIISNKSLTVQTQLSLITPRSRVLLGKLTGSLVVKKFPEFYGTWNFITAFTCPHKMSQT